MTRVRLDVNYEEDGGEDGGGIWVYAVMVNDYHESVAAIYLTQEDAERHAAGGNYYVESYLARRSYQED